MATSGFEGVGHTTSPDITTIQDKSGRNPAETDEIRAFMKEMRENYDRARQREHENIIEAYLDLGFKAGDAQWDATALNERQVDRRPCMVINLIPQFVRQVTGEQRQLKPSIKVIGTDGRSTIKTAEVYTNLIRYIENRSDAEYAYTNGGEQQVTAGVGHWRVDREYASESTFDQELVINAIDDGISVLWDPDSNKPTREDAMFCFVPVDMSRKKFEDTYPGKTADSMEIREYQWRTEWSTDDHVRVSEYWIKKPVTRKLALLPDGGAVNLDDMEDGPEKDALLASNPKIEERPGHEVWRYLVSLTDILEEGQLSPGQFIPIVPCFGEEVRIGRRIVRHGMVRFMRDPQRIYNYYASAEVECTAMQPKAPWLGTERNFGDADILNMWQNANLKNYPYLLYIPDTANGGKAPERIPPAVSSQGILEGIKRAEEDMYRVTGVYPSSLGQQGNETSGKAIQSRQREGDTGTYVYIDNFTRAIKHTGRILVDMIPHVYDTAREIRILGEDGMIDRIQVNQPKMELQGLSIIQRIENDVTVGSYDVVADVGPSYATRREEAKTGMITLLQTIPQMGPLLMDLVAKAQDWPMAEQIGERARMLLPPQIQIAEMMKEKGIPDDQIKQQMLQQAMQPQPDPKQAESEAKAQHIQMQTQREGLKAQHDQLKNAHEQKKIQREMLHTQTDVIQTQQEMMAERAFTEAKLEAMRLDNALKRQRLLHGAANGKASREP